VSCSEAPKKAPDTRAADEKAIRDGETTWATDWSSKDVSKIMDHYADDATLMVANQPIMKGTDDIRAGVKQMLADPNLSLNFTATTVEVSKGGDLAYTQGTYTMTSTDPKTKRPITEKGKYVTVYKKQSDGSWKAIEDIANADAAPVSPAPAKEPHKAKQKHARRRA
jgi:uncharacterized protein (TIGR02246 family)